MIRSDVPSEEPVLVGGMDHRAELEPKDDKCYLQFIWNDAEQPTKATIEWYFYRRICRGGPQQDGGIGGNSSSGVIFPCVSSRQYLSRICPTYLRSMYLMAQRDVY